MKVAYDAFVLLILFMVNISSNIQIVKVSVWKFQMIDTNAMYSLSLKLPNDADINAKFQFENTKW